MGRIAHRPSGWQAMGIQQLNELLCDIGQLFVPLKISGIRHRIELHRR
jgi:hypothetical protein